LAAPNNFLPSYLPYSKYRLMDFLFPESRLDWFGAGPSSPNKTGALLAICFVVSWWPTRRYRWGFWLSLLAALIISALLLQTESRGAIVATGIAVGLLAGFRLSTTSSKETHAKVSRYVLSPRSIALVTAIAALVLYSQQLGVSERVATMTTGEDESANVRVALYSAGLVSLPRGEK
jgi:O-antigen ligase